MPGPGPEAECPWAAGDPVPLALPVRPPHRPRSAPPRGSRQLNTPSAPAPSPFGGGGFLRSMAGGLVGGMLGGMLFRSLGFAGGGMGGMGGGIGLMDILLIGALLYGIYWFIKRRRSAAESAPAGTYYRESSPGLDAGQTAPPMQAYESGERKAVWRKACAISARWTPDLMKNDLPTVAWTSSSRYRVPGRIGTCPASGTS